jgi:hypothetical protein
LILVRTEWEGLAPLPLQLRLKDEYRFSTDGAASVGETPRFVVGKIPAKYQENFPKTSSEVEFPQFDQRHDSVCICAISLNVILRKCKKARHAQTWTSLHDGLDLSSEQQPNRHKDYPIAMKHYSPEHLQNQAVTLAHFDWKPRSDILDGAIERAQKGGLEVVRLGKDGDGAFVTKTSQHSTAFGSTRLVL